MSFETKEDPTARFKSHSRRLALNVTERAKALLADKPEKSYVEDAQYFAQLALDYAKLLEDHVAMVDNLSACQDRASTLIEQRRALAAAIEAIQAAKTAPEVVAALATAVEKARGFQ